MKIAVTAIDKKEGTFLNPRFGRCDYYQIYDEQGNLLEVLPNDAMNLNHGAGISAAQRMIDIGVDVIITGRVGPQAMDVFRQTAIEIYAAPAKRIDDLLADWKNGLLEKQ